MGILLGGTGAEETSNWVLLSLSLSLTVTVTVTLLLSRLMPGAYLQARRQAGKRFGGRRRGRGGTSVDRLGLKKVLEGKIREELGSASAPVSGLGSGTKSDDENLKSRLKFAQMRNHDSCAA